MSAAQSIDVAIVGGGLVGASLAWALQSLGYQVAVVEKVAFRAAAQPSYDDRTLALSHSSCQILSGLGLWDGLVSSATPIREICVAEPGRPGRVTLRASESGLEAFGHVIEARVFGAVVLERLQQPGRINWHVPATVTALRTGEECCELGVQSEHGAVSLQARLVVAADGAASAVRHMLGIGAHSHDYGQTAVICNVTPSEPHRGRAFEWLTDSGPFAILPHAGDRCGLVWSVPAERAQQYLNMEDTRFMGEAQQRFGMALGEFRKIGRRSAYPLKLVRADQDISRRVVIMGNAAHAIHPAGAQGFNLGLRDVAVLAELLEHKAGLDPGSEHVLESYSSWRRPDQDETVAWTDGMVRLFANSSMTAGLARTAGIMAHALIPPLRRRLASKAMGYRGRTPKLALGQPLGSAS